MNPALLQEIAKSIREACGCSFETRTYQNKSGGCINETGTISNGRENYFVKVNSAASLEMFEAEAKALKELSHSRAIRVPKPITQGLANGRSFLVLEALSFGVAGADHWETMGQQLAKLHRKTNECFGWHRDNTIGSTPQHNQWTEDWPTYFREQRLRPQFELAKRNGYHFEAADALLERIEDLLADHSPPPSLLHGDLWSGNVGFLEDGTPVIFDPATYYGDRETDLAFSEFFGGFPRDFYSSYNEEWPIEPGYERRKTLYNLYHALNHTNLFGGGYIKQATSMIGHILRK